MATLDLLQTHRAAALAAPADGRHAAGAGARCRRRQPCEIAVDGHNLEVGARALAQSLVRTTRPAAANPVAYVLAAGSFSDLISRMDMLRRVASTGRRSDRQIHRTQQLLHRQQLLLTSAAAQAAAPPRTRAGPAQLDSAIAHSKAVLAGVDASIRAQLAQERKRRSGLAAKDGGGTGSSGSATPRWRRRLDSNVFYGDCTWYGPGFAGHRTADGEIFDPTKADAASPWLPFGTELNVTNLHRLSVQVRVNDRGPFGTACSTCPHMRPGVHLSGWQRVRIRSCRAPRPPMFTL